MRFRVHSEFGVELMIDVQETKHMKTKAIFHSELREEVFFFKKNSMIQQQRVFTQLYSYVYILLLCLAQSWPTLSDPMDCSPPGSSVHGILQARILEWVAILFSRGSSPPRDQAQHSCTGHRFFTI